MRKVAIFFIAFGLTALACLFYFERSAKQDFDKSNELIIMRKIAHDLLLYAQDSTSRIPSAKQTSPYDFIIPFESQFAFLPDSLVNIINKTIIQNGLSNNYIVNVLEEKSHKVVFGYSMLADRQAYIIPCIGRPQEAGQYTIYIKFQPQQAFSSYVLLSLGLLAVFVGVWVLFKPKTKPSHPEIHTSPTLEEPTMPTHSFVTIGKYAFYPTEQRLEFDNEQIDLTAKETKLLSIFSAQLNQIVDRDRLQKEVWENEGVFVSRSLDMFISKLRKRLDKDEHIKLINIHGKGYKLICS